MLSLCIKKTKSRSRIIVFTTLLHNTCIWRVYYGNRTAFECIFHIQHEMNLCLIFNGMFGSSSRTAANLLCPIHHHQLFFRLLKNDCSITKWFVFWVKFYIIEPWMKRSKILSMFNKLYKIHEPYSNNIDLFSKCLCHDRPRLCLRIYGIHIMDILRRRIILIRKSTPTPDHCVLIKNYS